MAWLKEVVKYMFTPYDPALERDEVQRIKDVQRLRGQQGGPVFAANMREWLEQEEAGGTLDGMLQSDTVRYDRGALEAAGVNTEAKFKAMLRFETGLARWGFRREGEPEPDAWYDLDSHGPVYDDGLSQKEKEIAEQTMRKEFEKLARANPVGAKAFVAYVKTLGE